MPYNTHLMETPLRDLDPEIAEIMVCVSLQNFCSAQTLIHLYSVSKSSANASLSS